MFHFPSTRTAPPEIVRQLKEIDPKVELVYLAHGVWILGAVNNDQRLRDTAINLIKSTTRWGASGVDHGKLRLAKAHLQGFQVIAFYKHEPDNRIVRDLQERDWRMRHRWRQELEEREAESSGATADAARVKARTEHFEAAARDVWRSAFRGARQFHFNGLRRAAPAAA